MFTSFVEELAQADQNFPVQFQTDDRHTTAMCRKANQLGKIFRPAEMIRPNLGSRVKKQRKLARNQIKKSSFVKFTAIATLTCKCEVFKRVASTANFRYDMVESEILWREPFLAFAIFAMPASATSDHAPNFDRDLCFRHRSRA